MADKLMTQWHLYLIRNRQGSLYTGITTDVQRRFAEHSNGKGAKALRGKGPLHLVFHCPVGDRSMALKTERAVKKLTKAAKEKLITGALSLETISV